MSTRPATLLPNAHNTVDPDDVRWIIGAALEVSPKLSYVDPKRYRRVRDRILWRRFSASGARQLFDQLVSASRGELWPLGNGGDDTPAPGYTLRGKPVTKHAVMLAADLAAQACVTLLVEFPAHRLEDREARLNMLVQGGSWRVPRPWRRKAYARARSDLRMLMG